MPNIAITPILNQMSLPLTYQYGSFLAGVVFPLTEERGGREGRGREEGGRGREEGRDSPIIPAFLTFSMYKNIMLKLLH
jgi:hypothetical protein